MTRQYIGARYVPKFYDSEGAEWESGVTYEPLTIVTYLKNSYTSKKLVPPTIGNPLENPNYWVLTGNYSAQVAEIDAKKLNKFSNLVYVKDFGAVGDGVTDDTDSIQRAIDSFNGNVCVVFDPKNYLITRPLVITHSYTKLTGYVDHQRQVGSVGFIIADYPNGDIISVGNGSAFVENTELCNLRVTRKIFGDSTSRGIHLYNNTLMTSCINCGASGSRYGFYMGEGVNGLRINHCHITPHLSNGEAITTSFDVAGICFEGGTTGGSGLFVNNVVFYGNNNDTAETYAIKCTSDGQFGDMWFEMVECSGKISKVISIKGGNGFNNDVNISSITADHVVGQGIYLQSGNTDFNNINIEQVWFLLYGSANGIEAWNYNGINISQVMLRGDSDYNGNFMHFNGVKGMNVTDVIIKGNRCLRTGQLTECSLVRVTGLIVEIGTNTPFYTYNCTGECVFDGCILHGTNIDLTENCYAINCISDNTNTVAKVQLSPLKVNSGAGSTTQFTATVNGKKDNSLVDWYVGGARSVGTNITANGLLTIGSDETVGTIFVMAVDKLTHNTSAIAIIERY